MVEDRKATRKEVVTLVGSSSEAQGHPLTVKSSSTFLYGRSASAIASDPPVAPIPLRHATAALSA